MKGKKGIRQQDIMLLDDMLRGRVSIHEGGFYNKLIDLMGEITDYYGYNFSDTRAMLTEMFPCEDIMHKQLDHGNWQAEHALGRIFSEGILVPYNADKALYWFKRAYHDGDETVLANMQAICERENRKDDLDEFCIDLAKNFQDTRAMEYCWINKLDFSQQHPRQQELQQQYINILHRNIKQISAAEIAILEEFVKTKSYYTASNSLQKLFPVALEKKCRQYYEAYRNQHYFLGSGRLDKFCDLKSVEQNISNFLRVYYPEGVPEGEDKKVIGRFEDFLKVKDRLALSDHEKRFFMVKMYDKEICQLERHSPNYSMHMLYSYYHDNYGVLDECVDLVLKMMDYDHRLTYESCLKIIAGIERQEEEQAAEEHPARARELREIYLYLSPHETDYCKRMAAALNIMSDIPAENDINDMYAWFYYFTMENIVPLTLLTDAIEAQAPSSFDEVRAFFSKWHARYWIGKII